MDLELSAAVANICSFCKRDRWVVHGQVVQCKAVVESPLSTWHAFCQNMSASLADGPAVTAPSCEDVVSVVSDTVPDAGSLFSLDRGKKDPKFLFEQ